MRFLLDANMPRRAAVALRNLGHEAFDVRDLSMGGAPDSEIAAYAVTHHLALVTRDGDFADIRNYPPQRFNGILVLNLPDDANAAFIVSVRESLASNQALLGLLSGRLAIVTPGKIKFRPGASP